MITAAQWQTIDTVLLDMDGTLLDLHFDNYFWQTHMPKVYAREQGISEQQANERLDPIFRDEHGKLHWYSLDFWEETTGLELLPLKREVQHLIQIRPHAVEFLQRLRRLGKRALLVTNAHQRGIDLKLQVTGIGEHLEDIFTSHQFGAAKEHADFWPQLQCAAGFQPERALFIDDTVSVLDAAQNFGIAHVLAIAQPDSQRTREPITAHACIEHFSEIMPQ